MTADSEKASALADLPTMVAAMLKTLLATAAGSLGSELRSVVLFGSAAEGRLRATSDVNLIFVLTRFDQAKIDPVREALRAAQAAARVSVMFLLASEVADAAEVFAVKFADIARRHRVLFGDDAFAGISASRSARILRLRQVLLNLVLRLRERYAFTSLREEQLALVVAEAAGAMRAAAATILELSGAPVPGSREALARVAQDLGGHWDEALERMSTARETRQLPAGTASATLLSLIELAEALRAKVAQLS
jgi:predicted nucleotidyltransferase